MRQGPFIKNGTTKKEAYSVAKFICFRIRPNCRLLCRR